MKIPTKNFNFYTKVLENLTERGSFEWGDVFEEIKGTAYAPKNWMAVRGVLQQFINEGKIARDADLHKEKYFAL
jgi:hypothetical protein